MTDWDERFAAGDYPREPEPSSVLCDYVPAIPDGRALDVATGTGRNAVFLAEAGYEVDAVDASIEGLEVTRERAAERGVDDRLNAIRADVPTYGFPEGRYDLATISFYRAIDRFPDVVEALVPGGYLFVEHHLRSADPTPSGPSGDRYRFAANELLHAGLGLTVLYYDETTEERPGDRRRATARLLARRSHGARQSYPPRPERR
ncbi:methyltransferase domain-containing protein [Halorubrum sp. JWXQ-INN 858]|uniref:class I SAM-dependent methyltransferase n=1 Tax=Halorubrum sp. JWXQ-INN 858 TaxID=2690782 RepID=UPI001356E3D4|nr:class I SAM-dependent methyltransferase [Halorubrum sp. JWXQ-INN 858]MWV63892.1 methyltransferase domain-containing protein [Halorubrum sp. JWXQ-INN 858]